MAKTSLLGSSIGRKYAMAASALFLLVFLLQHFLINITSTFSPDLFNSISHFMGTNVLVQAFLQPVLMLGIVFHFVMGFVLEIQNRRARHAKYVVYKGGANSSWFSRNMLWSGLFILFFIAFHLKDFWVHEMTVKYVKGDMTGQLATGGYRYYEELIEMFQNPIRVGVYVLSFVFLALHLLHGFQSAFQSVGANHSRWTPVIKRLGNVYAIAIPLGFVFIALYHFIFN